VKVTPIVERRGHASTPIVAISPILRSDADQMDEDRFPAGIHPDDVGHAAMAAQLGPILAEAARAKG
jgi:hypothetical protein